MSLAQEKYNGALNIRWGLGSTTVTITGCTGLFQEIQTKQNTEKGTLRNQRGSELTAVDYNPTYTGTITYVCTDATTPNAGTAAITYPFNGTVLTIVTDSGDPVQNGVWLCEDVSIDRGNTKMATVTLSVKQYPLITS